MGKRHLIRNRSLLAPRLGYVAQGSEEGYRYRYELPKGSIVYAHHRPRDQESLKEILHDSSNGGIDVKPYIQRIALNMSLSTNCGYRIGGTVGDDLLKEITTVEATMAFYRSTSSNWQDYVPLLRLFSKRTSEANSWKVRMQKCMSDLHDPLKQKIVISLAFRAVY